MKRNLTFALCFLLSVTSLAETPKAVILPSYQQKNPPANPILNQRAEDVLKTAMKVTTEKDGIVTLNLLSQKQSFANKTQMMFFRRKGQRLEVVANGIVIGEKLNTANEKVLEVEINRDTIIKYPQTGDFAVPLSDPNSVSAGNKTERQDYLVPDENSLKKANELPGFLELGAGLISGGLNSDSSTQANQFKKTSSYRFTNIHFAYASDFFPVFIEYDSHGGTFPTGTYYQTKVASKENVSTLVFGYRFSPLLNRKLYISAKLSILSSDFSTDNSDENLLSTKTSGLGIGPHFSYQFVQSNWRPARNDFFLHLQDIFLEGIYYPTISATDNGISRGTASSGSSATSVRIGFNALAYLNFVPLIKRFVLQASYGTLSYNLKFQGTTTSEVGNPYHIPSAGTGKESENDFRFFIGIRFDDPIRSLVSKEVKK